MRPPSRLLALPRTAAWRGRRGDGRSRRGAALAAALVTALAASACAGPAAGPVTQPTTTVVAQAARPKAAPPSPSPTPTPRPTPRPTPTRSTLPAAAEPHPRPSTTPRHATPTPTPTRDKCETTYDGPPFYTSPPTAGGDGSNGDIPASLMTAVPWAVDSHGTGFWLLTKAERALVRLDAAFRARFGHHLDIDLAYRDLATQKAMYQALGPSVAAKPGTSKHGTGLAIDVPEWPCQYGWGTTQRAWLVNHGPSYGWYSPWGMTRSTDAEYWHFEYRG